MVAEFLTTLPFTLFVIFNPFITFQPFLYIHYISFRSLFSVPLYNTLISCFLCINVFTIPKKDMKLTQLSTSVLKMSGIEFMVLHIGVLLIIYHPLGRYNVHVSIIMIKMVNFLK